MRRRSAVAAGAGAVAATFAFAGPADAHGLVGRADLPIPAWLFGWAAAFVLAVSFVALAALWPRPRLQEVRARPLFRMPILVDMACGVVGVLVFIAVVYSGFAGTKTATANLAPTMVYVIFWVGFPVASLLCGDVFRAFNPWVAVARVGAWTARHLIRRPLRAPLAYPAWLGHWPAVAGIVGFAWLELAYTNKADPVVLASLAVAYAGIQLVAMVLFGVERWSRTGDAFSSYFNLYSRLSPFVRRGRTLCVRPPLSGAPALAEATGTVALLCAAIGSTTFDGFSNGPVWAAVNPQLKAFFSGLGLGSTTALELAASVGLAACILIIGAFYRLGVRGMQTVGGGFSDRELAMRFAHTLIPIAFAYALAHYFSLLVDQGQAVGYLASNPLGNGSDLFGTAHFQIDYNVISSIGIWYVQVAALVCGHVAGLVLAHDRAVAMYPRVRDASRSQYWMLVVMVGFTSLGLWLLSAVNS